MSIFTTFAKQSMINRLSNPINRNRSAAKISKVMSSSGQSHVGGHLKATIYLRPRCQKQVLPITCFKDIQNKSHQVVDNTSKVGLQSSSSVLNKAFAHVADRLLGGEVEGVDDGIFFPQTLMQIEELAVPSVHIPFRIPYSDVHLCKKKAQQ